MHSLAEAGNKDATRRLVAWLEELTSEQPDNGILLVYLGSAYTLASRDAFIGPGKLRFLMTGRDCMDRAVTMRPDDANPDTYADSNANSNTNTNADADPDAYSNTYTNANADANPNAYSDANSDTNSDTNSDRQTDRQAGEKEGRTKARTRKQTHTHTRN